MLSLTHSSRQSYRFVEGGTLLYIDFLHRAQLHIPSSPARGGNWRQLVSRIALINQLINLFAHVALQAKGKSYSAAALRRTFQVRCQA